MEPIFDAVYRENVQRVARWARHLLGPSSDVDDVIQDVFVTAHRLLPRFRGEATVATWLFRLTSNAVRSQRRGVRLRRWLLPGAATLNREPTAGPDPHEHLEQSEAAGLVYRALDSLPEKYRTVLILSRLEGLPAEVIAELTGIKAATVWVRVHRGRELFARQLHRLQRRPAPQPDLSAGAKSRLGGAA